MPVCNAARYQLRRRGAGARDAHARAPPRVCVVVRRAHGPSPAGLSAGALSVAHLPERWGRGRHPPRPSDPLIAAGPGGRAGRAAAKDNSTAYYATFLLTPLISCAVLGQWHAAALVHTTWPIMALLLIADIVHMRLHAQVGVLVCGGGGGGALQCARMAGGWGCSFVVYTAGPQLGGKLDL
jgi:hypothetical protein